MSRYVEGLDEVYYASPDPDRLPAELRAIAKTAVPESTRTLSLRRSSGSS